MSVCELRFYSWNGRTQSYTFCGAGLVNELEYENDYLNPTEQTVEIKSFSLIHSINSNDVMVFELFNKPQLCVIKAFSIDEGSTASVTFAPFVAYFNVDEQIIIPENMAYYNSNWGTNLLSVISQIISYRNSEVGFGTDNYANKINAFTDGSSIEWWYLTEKILARDSAAVKYKTGNIFNDILVPAFKQYRIYVDFSFIESPFRINAEVKRVSGVSTMKIETCLPEVIEKQVNVEKSDDYNALRIMGIDYYNNNNWKWTIFKNYYKRGNKWLSVESDLPRITPVKSKAVIIEHDNGESLSPDTNAVEQLISDYLTELNFYYSETTNVSLEFMNSSKHLSFSDFNLFDTVEVYHKDEVYAAILTAIKYTQRTTVLTFGTARLELTKKLRR